MSREVDVVVVGSVNRDYVCRVQVLPAPGETVLGGEASGMATERIWRFRPGRKGVVGAGTLPQATAGAAAATVGKTSYLIGGTGSGGTALADVVELTKQRTRVPEPKPDPSTGGTAGSAPTWPFAGQLMIADRGNDRLIVVDAKKKILWRFPSKEHPAPLRPRTNSTRTRRTRSRSPSRR